MEENNYCVYKHIFPNNKIYIGITKQQPEKRWKKGLGYNSHQTLMKKAIKKYGWENIKHEILFKNLNRKDACKIEMELIALHDSTNKKKGYNISQGGEGTIGVKQTEESKLKNRIAHLGRKASLETREKISKSNKGKHNRKRTDEQKRKISEATKKAMQDINLKNKLRILATKRKNNCKKVKCIETGEIYNTIKEASIYTKTCCSSISQVCHKKRETANKLHWEFVKEENKC